MIVMTETYYETRIGRKRPSISTPKMTKSANSTSASNYLFVELNMNMELSDGIGFIFFLKCE